MLSLGTVGYSRLKITGGLSGTSSSSPVAFFAPPACGLAIASRVTNFGSDGNLSIDFFGFTDVGENVLVQPDGKIVVGGLATNNFGGYGVARINP